MFLNTVYIPVFYIDAKKRDGSQTNIISEHVTDLSTKSRIYVLVKKMCSKKCISYKVYNSTMDRCNTRSVEPSYSFLGQVL